MSTFIQRLPGEGSVEDQEIQDGINLATHPYGGSVWEYGQYVERHDGDEWTPLLYGEMTEAQAEQHHEQVQRMGAPFRNSRVVRRVVGPWEVRA